MLIVAAAISSWSGEADAQGVDRTRPQQFAGGRSETATIFWNDVPLIDALSRLEKVFDDSVFLDRRVDPDTRVSLNRQVTSLEQAVNSIAVTPKVGASRIGGIVYVGPIESASRLAALTRTRIVEANRLPEPLRATLLRKRSLSWPRLAQPRELVASLVERIGWRLEGGEQIPHDLWRAGELSDLSAVEQLTLLLVGFDLTLEVRGDNKTIAAVPLETSLPLASDEDAVDVSLPSDPPAKKRAKTKQVYSLRLKEQPVGPVLRQLAQRLNWQLKVDEAAIAAAGLSLDTRVSMAVENVDQDQLLEALLEPAGLAYEREDNRITVAPGEPAVD
jgi:hypothetical protein